VTRVLDPVLKELRELVLRMGSRAEAILDKALRSVWERDGAAAAEVPGDDLAIDRLDVEIDDAVLKALALQAPVAEDLREVVAIKMIANDLERVGDLARNIAKSGARLSQRPPRPFPPILSRLARDTQRMLRSALDAFTQSDADRARAVLAEDDRIDGEQDEVVATALHEIPVQIAKNLERVADHATNIAEDVILVVEARNVKHAAKLRR
jgi:phosphate transport system protein